MAFAGSRQSATTAALAVFWLVTPHHIATYDSTFGGFRHKWKLYPLQTARVSRFENQVTVWARRMRPRSIIFGHRINNQDQHELAQAHEAVDALSNLISAASQDEAASTATSEQRAHNNSPSSAWTATEVTQPVPSPCTQGYLRHPLATTPAGTG